MHNFPTSAKADRVESTEDERFRADTHMPQRANMLRPIFRKSCSVVESEHQFERFLKPIKAQRFPSADVFRHFAESTELQFLAKITCGSEEIFCRKYLSDRIRPFQLLATGQHTESLLSIHAEDGLFCFGSSDGNGLAVRGGA
jgi:hypothetical protein